MGLPRSKINLLPEEELFKRYYVLGGPGYSYNKLQRWYTNEYGLNPDTKKEFTVSAFIQAVNRYLVRNYKNPDVKNAFIRYYLDMSFVVSDEEYLYEISKRAKTIFKASQYKSFLRENPNLERVE